MKVHSLFKSLQGEGLFQGLPSFFVRLHGCNLDCDYCDAVEAVKGSKYIEMTAEEIAQKVKEAGVKDLCITGGEPLCQKEELNDLICRLSDYRITLETNGSLDISGVTGDNIFFSVDWKTPGSGNTSFNEKNIEVLKNRKGWIKFVVADSKDLEFVEEKLGCLDGVKALLSPVFEKEAVFFSEVADFVLKHGSLRLQLQLHKIIGVD